jgi:segregation and condensation protein B
MSETENIAPEQLLFEPEPERADSTQVVLRALIEAVVYVSDEPLAAAQIATALGQPRETVEKLLKELAAEYNQPHHGIAIREVAGGYKMATKPEHHEAVRAFVKSLKPPLKLSLAALETLAVIAYKQPITAPEVMEIRGVQGAGVLKTLLDRKVITTAGRKNVIGRPILYKTTKDFLVQFGLKDLSELPTLKEFEELGRFALAEAAPEPEAAPVAEAPPESERESEAAPVAEAPPEAETEPESTVPPEPEATRESAAAPEAEAALAAEAPPESETAPEAEVPPESEALLEPVAEITPRSPPRGHPVAARKRATDPQQVTEPRPSGSGRSANSAIGSVLVAEAAPEPEAPPAAEAADPNA